MNTPDISIIVPFYGVEGLVAECLESILSQNYPAFEVICIDDRSPDGSREIVEFYAERDRRIVMLEHEENQGLGPARNTGVLAARGDYLMFLDSDDRLSSPGALRCILEVAVETNSEMVAGSASRLNSDGSLSHWDRRFEKNYGERLIYNLPGPAAYAALIRMPGANYLPLRSWGYLFNREFYRSLNILHPAGVHEDIGHNALVASAARNIHYCPNIIVDYRMREGSISQSRWNAATIDSYLRVWHHFRDNHARFGLQNMTGNAALHVLRNCCWMLKRNAIAAGDEDYILDKISGLLEEADSRSDPEMLASVLKILHETLKDLDMAPGTFARVVDHLPTRSFINGAQHLIGIRHFAIMGN